jgi:hypothetical protein
MAKLNYQSLPLKPPRDRLNGNQWGMLLPGLIMATLGWFCCLPAAMANDSPYTKTGPMYYAAVFAMMATGPIGVATVYISLALFKRRSVYYLWLNWLVPAAYFGLVYLLLTFSQR